MQVVCPASSFSPCFPHTYACWPFFPSCLHPDDFVAVSHKIVYELLFPATPRSLFSQHRTLILLARFRSGGIKLSGQKFDRSVVCFRRLTGKGNKDKTKTKNESHRQLQVALLSHYNKEVVRLLCFFAIRYTSSSSSLVEHRVEEAVAEEAVDPAAAEPGLAAGRRRTCNQTAEASLYHRNLG